MTIAMTISPGFIMAPSLEAKKAGDGLELRPDHAAEYREKGNDCYLGRADPDELIFHAPNGSRHLHELRFDIRRHAILRILDVLKLLGDMLHLGLKDSYRRLPVWVAHGCPRVIPGVAFVIGM